MNGNNDEQKTKKWSSLTKTEQKEINSEFRSQQIAFVVLRYSFLAIDLIAIIVLMVLSDKKIIDIFTFLILLGIISAICIPLCTLMTKTYLRRFIEFLKSKNIELDTKARLF